MKRITVIHQESRWCLKKSPWLVQILKDFSVKHQLKLHQRENEVNYVAIMLVTIYFAGISKTSRLGLISPNPNERLHQVGRKILLLGTWRWHLKLTRGTRRFSHFKLLTTKCFHSVCLCCFCCLQRLLLDWKLYIRFGQATCYIACSIFIFSFEGESRLESLTFFFFFPAPEPSVIS